MSRRLRQAAVVFVVIVVAAQFVRPGRANPPVDPHRTIEAQLGTATPLVAVLDRACSDCHSNGTVWRWYTQIAPLSWLMAYSVKEGRKVVNFSEWAAYAPAQQRELLDQSCRAASQGKMPGAYTVVRPQARLSAQDVETICAASRQADANIAGAAQ